MSGDLEADFGFAGMFWAAETALAITRFRAYDPELGRWLSRDPLPHAEAGEGPNLYTYVGDNPIGSVDPLGLCCEKEGLSLDMTIVNAAMQCDYEQKHAANECANAQAQGDPQAAAFTCAKEFTLANQACGRLDNFVTIASIEYATCVANNCGRAPSCPKRCGFVKRWFRGTALIYGSVLWLASSEHWECEH